MTLIDLVFLLLVAGICGSIGRAIAGGSRGGCIVSIGVGFVGALVGSWLSRVSGLSEVLAVRVAGTTFPIVWSIVGAAAFIAVLALISGGRRRR